jgi:hypothetical protein
MPNLSLEKNDRLFVRSGNGTLRRTFWVGLRKDEVSSSKFDEI